MQPAGSWRLTPIILADHEEDLSSKPAWQVVGKTLPQKSHHKKGLVEGLKVLVLRSSPSTTKKKKKKVCTTTPNLEN
jgi:hypothetical protein